MTNPPAETPASRFPRTPRILFACPQTVLDVSNGASLHAYTMLQMLAREGFEVRSFGGGIFDNPSGIVRIPNLQKQLEENTQYDVLKNVDRSAGGEHPIVHHFFTRFKSTVWDDMTCGEMRTFLNRFSRMLRSFKPDLVLGYGCDALSRSMWAEAKAFGIPTAYVICNGNHHWFRFPQHDLLLTDSETTAAMYRKADGICVHATGPFVIPSRVIAKKRSADFVTFINPSFGKGVAVMARLILMANRERPDIPFQIVETRHTFRVAARTLRKPDGEYGSAFEKTTFSNIVVRPAESDVREIYRNTGLVVVPSVGYESFGRVALEANMNGIPVLASTQGGLPEAVGEGGILLDPPASCSGEKDRWTVLPTEEEVRPWADALYRLWDERLERFDVCRKAALRHYPDVSTRRLVELLTPLLERQAGSNPDFDRLGSIRFPDDPIPERDRYRES